MSEQLHSGELDSLPVWEGRSFLFRFEIVNAFDLAFGRQERDA